MSPNTERKYRLALLEAGLLFGPTTELPELGELSDAVTERLAAKELPAQQISSVEDWLSDVKEMVGRGAGAKAVYDRLRLTPGFQGSYPAIKRLCRRLRRVKGVAAKDVTIPIDETPPGRFAQVDFGYVGKLYDPIEDRPRKAWVFVMVLNYSRHMFAEVVFDQKVQTWINLHINTFKYFGGVPGVIVPDNLKSAVVRAAFRPDDTSLNRSYRELARYYGFQVDPTPPRAPEKKGRVESAVKYVKNNFFKPRKPADVDMARTELSQWLQEIAGLRVHGTTGQQPLVRFEQQERSALKALPSTGYEPIVWLQAKVHPDCHLKVGPRLYSVPWRLVGAKLWVKATPDTVIVYGPDDHRVATHSSHSQGSRTTVEAHLPEYRRDYRHRTREYWQERAAQLGEVVGDYIKEVFDSDDVLCQLRTVQGMVIHLEHFPQERAENACRRARFYGSYRLGELKSILRKGLDFESLPGTAETAPPPATRFARATVDISFRNPEILEQTQGVTSHECH
jgi:transposase